MERFACTSVEQQRSLKEEGHVSEFNQHFGGMEGKGLRRTKTVTNLDIQAVKGLNLFEEKFKDAQLA